MFDVAVPLIHDFGRNFVKKQFDSKENIVLLSINQLLLT